MSERAEISDDGCESSFCSFPPPCSTPRSPTHSGGFPRLNLAEAGNLPEKTRIAFYCRIDHLNNSQRGNPSPTMRSVVLSASHPLVPVPHITLVSLLYYIVSRSCDPTCLVASLVPDLRFIHL